MKQKLAPLSGTIDIIRSEDDWGSGHFGAPREERTHRGIDIILQPGDTVFCPFDATIVREAPPYDGDPRFSGVLLAGTGLWTGYQIKLFYLDTAGQGSLNAGQELGTVQDIGLRYAGITPHVHMELWHEGNVIDPAPFLRS